MAAKLILAIFVASLRVNGSPCKPSSSASISSVFTSGGDFTTTTDGGSTGPEPTTHSSDDEFTFTSLAHSLVTDETTSEIALTFLTTASDVTETGTTSYLVSSESHEETSTATTDPTSTLAFEASSLETLSFETSASETDWNVPTSTTSGSLTTTDLTIEQSTTTESAAVTTWSSEPETTSSITSTTTTAEAQTPIGFYNGGFEDDSSLDALPWVIGRSVTIPNDPANAHSGDRYTLVKFPITGTGRPVYPLRQTVSGLDYTKKYLWAFHWAFTDFGTLTNTRCNFYTYFGSLVEYTTFYANGIPTNEYFKRQYLVSRPEILNTVDILFHWQCSNSNPSTQWDGAEIRIDDVSLIEYDPPCTVIESPPRDLVCGETGAFPNSANSYLIGSEIPLGPFETCAQICAGDPECKTFTASGGTGVLIGRNVRCKLYSASPEELGFSSTPGGQSVYQPGCFECRPSE